MPAEPVDRPGPRASGFAGFVAAEGGRLLRDAYLLTGDEDAAHRLLRSAMERLYRSWDGPWETSLAQERALTALVREYLHGRRRRSDDDSLFTGVQPGDVDAGWRLLDQLEPRRRASLVLPALGLSDSRTAAAMACSTGTVRRYRSQAQAQLRAAVGHEDVPRLVRATLDDRAGLHQHPDPELAASVVTRVELARRARRAAIAVLATVIGVAVVLVGTGRAGRSVTPNPSPSLPSAVPSSERPSSERPSWSPSPADPYDIAGRLREGPPIEAIPRVEIRRDGTFFLGGGFEYRLAGAPIGWVKAGDGWLVQSHRPDWAGEAGDAGAVVTYLRTGASPLTAARTAEKVVVSPDGRRFAFVEPPEAGSRTGPTVVVVDVATGRERARRTMSAALPQATAEAWTADGIVVVSPYPEATVVFDARLREYLRFRSVLTVVPSVGADGYSVVISRGVREPYCAVIRHRLDGPPSATIGCGEVVTAITDGSTGWIVRLVSRTGHVQLVRVNDPDGWTYLPSDDVIERLPLTEDSCLHESSSLVCPIYPVRYYNDKLQPLWVRWNPDARTVERALLPAGVEGVWVG